MHASVSERLLAPHTGVRWRRWRLWFTAAMTLVAGYVAGYFAARTVHRTPADEFQFSLGSRWTDRVFAPAIRLERAWLEQNHPDAGQIVAAALADARSSNRRVLLAVGTSSCLPCRQLEQFLNEQSPIISPHIVVVKVDVDGAMRHGDAVQRNYRRSHGSLGDTWYFPWLAILDGDGALLGTSDDGPAGVIGIPQGGPNDRAWFLELLRRAAPRMPTEEIACVDAAAIAFHNSIHADDR